MPDLTSTQKWRVCDLAAKAYAAWPGWDEHERTVGAGKNGLTTWRHDQQETAVGVRSLRHCSDADFRTLESHFHRLRMEYLREASTAALSFSP